MYVRVKVQQRTLGGNKEVRCESVSRWSDAERDVKGRVKETVMKETETKIEENHKVS